MPAHKRSSKPKSVKRKTSRAKAHPKKVDPGDEFYSVRFRSPRSFTRFRRPDWAKNAASSVAAGSEVTMGKTRSGTWKIQSVLVRKRKGRTTGDARGIASKIAGKLER